MARPKAPGTRKNVILSKNSEKRLKKIKEAAELPSEAEAIRVALREYVRIMELQMGGANLFYRHKDDQQEFPLERLYEAEVM